jgi:hypothetical protein
VRVKGRNEEKLHKVGMQVRDGGELGDEMREDEWDEEWQWERKKDNKKEGFDRTMYDGARTHHTGTSITVIKTLAKQERETESERERMRVREREREWDLASNGNIERNR